MHDQETRSIPQWVLWGLLSLFTIIWFSNIEYRKLVRPDEGRYAEIPREMQQSGDWLTPRLNGIKYFEKPPLQYWATAAAYSVFGVHHWTARLWAALTGFLGILLVYYAIRRLYDPTIALYAAIVLASSLWYVAMGHFNALDMGLCFFLNAALLFFLLAQREHSSRAEMRRWMLACWAAMALAVLSKGLIGIAIPCAVLLLYSLWQRDWLLFTRLHLGLGLSVFLLITAPWFVLVSLENPEFFHFFFVYEHFERFLLPGHQREEAWWYFLPLVIAGVFPWFTLLPKVINVAKTAAAPRLLLLWPVFIVVFFSASSSKLPSYILPIIPALAILIALAVHKLSARQLFWYLLPSVVLALLVLPFVPQTLRFASDEVPVALYENYLPWLYTGWSVLFMVGCGALWLAYRGHKLPALLLFALAGFSAQMIILTGHDSLSPASSSYHLVKRIRERHGEFEPKVPFYSIALYEQTLPFYLQRTLTLVEYEGELAFGLAQEPWRSVADESTFIALWQAEQQAYAVMKPELYQSLKEEAVPMRLLGQDTRRAIVSRR